MTSPEALVRGLLEPLLDARHRPASERFDEALAAALAAGRVTPELARELRFWQRASVHEVTDHVRAVLPAVLPVALVAVAEAGDDAQQAAADALSAWQDRTPTEGQEAVAAPAGRPQDAAGGPQDATGGPDDAAGGSDRATSGPDGDATEGQATDEVPAGPPLSEPPQDGAAMSPHVRRRLFVAGLTSTA